MASDFDGEPTPRFPTYWQEEFDIETDRINEQLTTSRLVREVQDAGFRWIGITVCVFSVAFMLACLWFSR